jgi:hypothetical protein
LAKFSWQFCREGYWGNFLKKCLMGSNISGLKSPYIQYAALKNFIA